MNKENLRTVICIDSLLFSSICSCKKLDKKIGISNGKNVGIAVSLDLKNKLYILYHIY